MTTSASSAGSAGVQNEQTFDAVHVINQSIPKLTIDATYFNQVNRVLGKESALGRYHGDGYLANVRYQTPIGSLVGFGYWLGFCGSTAGFFADRRYAAVWQEIP